MLFENYKPQELEPEIQQFWEKNKIVEQLRKKNKKGKKFSFLQGPPYTSGKVHLGTAWNTSLKDIILRYKRSRGFNVWDRNGYDVHGLPTEHKVTAKFNLETKEQIDQFGMDKFILECIKFSKEMGEQMTKDFLRIGSTLDYSDTYMALTNEYMEGEWWLAKQAWDKKRLYLGEKAITWCGNCATALAKHELEYKDISDDSIYLKFKIKGTTNEYLLIWTTTPWTIPLNLAVVVHPEFDYVKCKVGQEYWIVAKELAKTVISKATEDPYEIVETFKGKKLEGIEYLPVFPNAFPEIAVAKKEQQPIFTVLLSREYVHLEDGTGLVHFAPGCGESDYELCLEKGIKPFNVIDEQGVYPKDHPMFGGLTAKKSDKNFIELMKDNGSLIAQQKYRHSYAHCWRCRQAIVYRTTKQWFFKIEDLKEAMIKEDKNVTWVPATNAFTAWTNNLRDNSISRQRYWGTPLPIWKCDQDNCSSVEVIGSIAELKKKSKKVPKDLHRPWIDEVTWNCQCKKGKMKRIPEIFDVWIDAGTASWNCLYFPQKNKLLKDFFPVDLILEATEQVRLWFSMLSICSQLGFDKNCYKNVYMHGMLRDLDGVKMSKSLGNIITPDEMIAKHGADVLRYYMCQTNAGQDIKFSWDEAALKGRYLQILWNLHKLLISLAKENKINPYKIKAVVLDSEEKYIISKLHSTIKKTTELFDAYHLDETISLMEQLYLELSRVYVQMIREKSAIGQEEEKEACIYTIGQVLLETIKMFNIIAPFITEAMYLNLKEEFGFKEESITHYSWPKFDSKKIDEKLENEMSIAWEVITAALHAREKANLGLRWPVKEIVLETENAEIINAAKKLKPIILKQTNAKHLDIITKLPGVKITMKSDYGKIGSAYGPLSPQIIAKLTIDSPETIVGHIHKENRYNFNVEGKEVSITKDMLTIERVVPEPYQESESKYGIVYINKERNSELEAEGYARELMRQIQSSRKKEGLEKLDRIKLTIQASASLQPMLEKYSFEIKEKVGADTLEFVPVQQQKSGEKAEVQIKKEKIKFWF